MRNDHHLTARRISLWIGLAVASTIVAAKVLEALLITASVFINVNANVWRTINLTRLAVALGVGAVVATLLSSAGSNGATGATNGDRSK